jgi:phosphoribosylformylglycinamidine synthase I
MKPRALILRTAGTNCDAETAYAFDLAGAVPEPLHINRLLQNPALLDRYQILAFPGGFSYGDDIAAGRILANQIGHHLGDACRAFIDSGRPIIGICNGFQVLVKTELLPGSPAGSDRVGQTCTLTHNDCGRFIDRWVHLGVRPSKCVWTQELQSAGRGVIELPIAHGEGKFVPGGDTIRHGLRENAQVVLTYARSDGSPARGQSPDNPNGSVDDIAGVCDPTGLVFGLMPHPERFVDPTQHPAWTRMNPLPAEGQGVAIFRSAVKHVAQAVGAGV